MGERTSGHAIVIGGGIGGLLAARALAGHAERVTLLERDRLPIDAVPGAPFRRTGTLTCCWPAG